jgi:hypothetical protein
LQPGLQTSTPTQTPAAQWSFCVHDEPSEQAAPSARGTWTQSPLATSQKSVVQVEPSPQGLADPPVHVPNLQKLPSVQGLPSSQACDCGAHVIEQAPVAGSQPSIVQGFPSSQADVGPLHAPPVHVSPLVQASPSSQGAPSGPGADAQPPVTGSHSPTRQAPGDAHTTGAPVHCPPSQTSPVVHASPSSQVTPSSRAGWRHPP